MEHHSNLIPWQMICRERRLAVIKAVPVDGRGVLDWTPSRRLLSPCTGSWPSPMFSKFLGTIPNPVTDMTRRPRGGSPRPSLDGAQAVPISLSTFAAIGCDFLCPSRRTRCWAPGIGVTVRPARGAGQRLEAGAGRQREIKRSGFDHAPVERSAQWRLRAGTAHRGGGRLHAAVVVTWTSSGWRGWRLTSRALCRVSPWTPSERISGRSPSTWAAQCRSSGAPCRLQREEFTRNDGARPPR